MEREEDVNFERKITEKLEEIDRKIEKLNEKIESLEKRSEHSTFV